MQKGVKTTLSKYWKSIRERGFCDAQYHDDAIHLSFCCLCRVYIANDG